MDNIVDLDVLRPAKRMVRLNGKDIDVTFIPCAITFELGEISDRIEKLDTEEIKAGGPTTRLAFELAVEMCAVFCAWKYPEMDKQWFMEHTDAMQIEMFANELRKALDNAYKGVGTYGKN